MNKISIVLLGLVALTYATDNWAVLVAGSDGYWNYRHQSDVCHAYQILKKNGIPEDHIIMIAKDDIAYNTYNPVKGKIFNKPDGPDVYNGCVIEYSGDECTPDTFYAVLRGDSTATNGKRVLKSTEDSNVFIYYSDHGNSGLIAMPVGGEVFADKLNDVLKEMHDKKMYKELVFYLEACFSGSMFRNILPDNINIYATTAANHQESSYGAYCGPEAHAGGHDIGSCLGDEYSINWMEDSDEAPRSRTVKDQYDLVKGKTQGSHVMEFGSDKVAQNSIW